MWYITFSLKLNERLLIHFFNPIVASEKTLYNGMVWLYGCYASTAESLVFYNG